MRFSPTSRLKNRAMFDRVFAERRPLHAFGFTFLLADNELGTPRVGFVIKKKNLPRAVDRNRIRRILRETFRHQQDRLGGLDVVVIVKPSLCQSPKDQWTPHVQKAWKRLVGSQKPAC